MRSSVLTGFSLCMAFGQTPAMAPAFEVASVKPAPSPPVGAIGLFTYPGGRIVVSNYTLRNLIHDAYEIEDYQILGGARWVLNMTLAGYFLGEIPVVKQNFEIIVLGIVFVSVLPMVFEFVRQRFLTTKSAEAEIKA